MRLRAPVPDDGLTNRTERREPPMHPMTSVTLTHAHHAESQRRALGQRRGRDTRITDARRHLVGLRTLLRRAAELPQRLTAPVGQLAGGQRLGDGLLEPCADGAEALRRLS